MPKFVSMFIGQVVRKNSLWEAARVRVFKMKLDHHLTMYFNTRTHYWATDPHEETKEGDIVLIKSLGDKHEKWPRVTHSVKEIVFPLGQTVDPITGKQCRGPEYIDLTQRNLKDLDTLTKS